MIATWYPRAAALGAFAKTFGGTTPVEVLSQARTAGFTTTQYNMTCSGLAALPTHVRSGVVNDLRHAIADTGVSVSALSATYNMIHPDREVRTHGQRSLTALARVARDIGCPVLTLCTGSRNTDDQWAPHPGNALDDAWCDLLLSLEAAIDVAEQNEVILGIEPEPANVINSALTARRLIHTVQSDRVGIIIDAANLIDPTLHTTPQIRRDVIAQAVDLLADRIVLIHAKDRAANGDVVPPGQGVVDFDEYFEMLAAAGVRAPVIAHGFTPIDAAATAVSLRNALGAAGLVR